MKISVKHHGLLSDLIQNSSKYQALKKIKVEEADNRRWQRNKGKDESFDLQAIIIGKTGYGKSSTLNALLGRSIVATSNNEACTREVQSFEFKINDKNYFSIADFPGIGESTSRDVEYMKTYKMMEDRSDVILYLLRADTRDFTLDRNLLDNFSKNIATRRKIILGVNFCDKIEPVSRGHTSIPSADQLNNIELKIGEINSIFRPDNKVIPYSADTHWNIDSLHSEIVRVVLMSDYIC